MMSGHAVLNCCKQVLLPRALRIRVLRGAPEHRCARISIRPPDLRPTTRNFRGMGLVHMGCVRSEYR